MISRRDDRADALVKIYLSVFTIAKLIKLAKPVTTGTFESIVTPPLQLRRMVEYARDTLEPRVPDLLRRYIPDISRIPLKQGITWDPTWKATASKMRSFHLEGGGKKTFRSFFRAFPF